MKVCAKCKNKYPLDNFPKDKTHKCGHRSYCFPCNRKIINEVTFKRKEKRKQENILNQESIKEYNKQYFYKNKTTINIYKNYRYKNNIQHKLGLLFRSRITSALKNNIKKGKSLDLLGCSIIEFKQHLEQQFKPEMTWLNHGEIWEIDHIKPCFSFNLINEEEQKECFNYKNTQPLFKTTEIAESFGYSNEIGNLNKNKKTNYENRFMWLHVCRQNNTG